MRTVPTPRYVLTIAAVAAVGAAATGCGSESGASGSGDRVVVTTSILGDVVRELAGDQVEVEVLMPAGADPHDFAPSARQAAAVRDAGVVVANGGGFEAGLADALDAAEDDGVRVVAALDLVEPLPLERDNRGDDEHGEGDVDPHFFTDPSRMADAVEALADQLAEHLDAIEPGALRERAVAYADELRDLDAEVEALLAAVPAERRVLVTNHDVLGYFAHRYGFEVLGVVIPGGSTLAEPGAADLDDLAHAVADTGVPAIFAETSAPSRLAEALAAEAGVDVEVVELFSESLGEAGSPADSYVGMVRTNAQRIAEALA